MKRTKIVGIVLFVAVVSLSIGVLLGWAQGIKRSHAPLAVGSLISYQGKLTNAQGAPVEGSKTATFSIYKNGQILVWRQTKNVSFTKGLFGALLDVSHDSISGGPLLFDPSQQYDLGVTVQGFPEMKQPITGVPFALVAQRLAPATSNLDMAGQDINNVIRVRAPRTENLDLYPGDQSGDIHLCYNQTGRTVFLGAGGNVDLRLSGTVTAENKKGTGVGIKGSATNGGTGVEGTGDGGGSYGVVGDAGTGVAGVRGNSRNGSGVWGASTYGDGVVGSSTNENSFKGLDTNGIPAFWVDKNGKCTAKGGFETPAFWVDKNGKCTAKGGFESDVRRTPVGIAIAGDGDTAGMRGYSDNGQGVWGETLDGTAVLGKSNMTGAIFKGLGPDGSPVFRVDKTGRGFFNGGHVDGGADYADLVTVKGKRTDYQPGDVLVISDDPKYPFTRTRTPYSKNVAGIYSTKPGTLGSKHGIGEPNENEVPLALTGIVPCKVSCENGAIKMGDLLVTSSTLGYAMKGTDQSRMMGAVVGKALQPLRSGKGIIEVLVVSR